MARIKRTLIVRKANGDTTRKDVFTPQRKVRAPRATMWQRAATMEPERKDLTKGQWLERGDLIRSIQSAVPNVLLEGASLDNLRDIMYSITRCQINICIHKHTTGVYEYPEDRGLVINVKDNTFVPVSRTVLQRDIPTA